MEFLLFNYRQDYDGQGVAVSCIMEFLFLNNRQDYDRQLLSWNSCYLITDKIMIGSYHGILVI